LGDASGVGDVGEEMWVSPQQALIVEFASTGGERRRSALGVAVPTCAATKSMVCKSMTRVQLTTI
jgi:hypothetical protein